jgi:hypothetical protein
MMVMTEMGDTAPATAVTRRGAALLFTREPA